MSCIAGLSSATNFTIVSSTCNNVSLSNNASCTVGVQGTPTSTGAKTANLILSCSNAPDVVAALAVTGTTPVTGPQISASSTYFADTPVGTAAAQNGSAYLTFYNSSNTTLTGCTTPRLSDTTGTFTIRSSTCGSSMSANSSCSIYINATPTQASTISTTLQYGCPAYGGYTSSAFSIKGLAPPTLYFSTSNAIPTSNTSAINFGTFNNSTWPGSYQVYVHNRGEQNATGCSFTFTGTTSKFPNGTFNLSSGTVYAGNYDGSPYFNFSNTNTNTNGTFSETIKVTCSGGYTATTTVSFTVH